ncbi:unnamed protein product [Ixodes pacificus]
MLVQLQFGLNQVRQQVACSYGFSVGALFRVLCGEPLVNLPVILKLPMYDERLGQQFPFRTLSMVLSFVTLMATSHVAKRLFTKGTLPQKYDVCCCFTPAAAKDTADKDEDADNPSKNEKGSSRKKPSGVPRTNAPSMLEIEESGEASTSAVPTTLQKTDVTGFSETTAAPQEQVADGSQQNDVGKTSKEEAAGTSKKVACHNKKKKHNRKDKSKTDCVASSAKKETATSDKEGADFFG